MPVACLKRDFFIQGQAILEAGAQFTSVNEHRKCKINAVMDEKGLFNWQLLIF
jgi:hypothetical protein